MFVKIHRGTRIIVAICDENLLGKKFSDEKRNLEINIVGNFFNGESKNSKEVLKIIEKMKREDASFNIVGKESCTLALQSNLISENEILKIQEVPIALVLI